MKKCQLNEFVLTVAAQAAESVSMKRDFDYSGARRPPTLLVCLHPVSSTCHVPTTMHHPPTDDGENIRYFLVVVSRKFRLSRGFRWFVCPYA